MRINTRIFYVIVLIFLANFMMAQTEANKTVLKQISQQQNAKWNARQQRVQAYAAANNVDVYFKDSKGRIVQMVDVVDGEPQFYTTFNLGAAHTTRDAELWPGGSTGINIDGEGYHQLGEWDGGRVRSSHQEFTDQGGSRVTPQDGGSFADHATHVAGTMVAAGVRPQAKGMAFKATLKSWEWSNDESEMAGAAANGLEISNHSYGFIRGWDHNNGNWTWHGTPSISPDEDYHFGFYNVDSRTLDNIAYNAPNYLIVRAAGNDRGEGPSDAGNGKAEKRWKR